MQGVHILHHSNNSSLALCNICCTMIGLLTFEAMSQISGMWQSIKTYIKSIIAKILLSFSLQRGVIDFSWIQLFYALLLQLSRFNLYKRSSIKTPTLNSRTKLSMFSQPLVVNLLNIRHTSIHISKDNYNTWAKQVFFQQKKKKITGRETSSNLSLQLAVHLKKKNYNKKPLVQILNKIG